MQVCRKVAIVWHDPKMGAVANCMVWVRPMGTTRETLRSVARAETHGVVQRLSAGALI